MALIRALRLLYGNIEVIQVQRQRLVARVRPDPGVEHPRRTPEISLVDGSYPTSTYHADQAGMAQDIYVICDGALWTIEGGGDLRHAGRPLMEQTEDGRPKSIPDGLDLNGGRECHRVIEVVIRHRLACHRGSD